VASSGTAREDLPDQGAAYAAASTYRLYAIQRSVMDLEQPVRLTLSIAELATA
jgi:hypothetical protein